MRLNKTKKYLLACFLSLVPTLISASSPEYIALADSADNYIKAENWIMAEQTILKALRLEPGNFTNSLLLSNLGVVQTQMGDLDKALESFRLGLSIAPNSSVIYANRARTYLHLSRYEDALDDLNSTLSIDSIQEWPLQTRGFLLIDKDPKKAAEDFTRLSIRFPKNPYGFTGLAAIAENQLRNEDALTLYDKALVVEDSPEIRFSRILLKINMQKFNEASEDISDSISRFPHNGELYLLRGYLNKLRFRNDDAAIDKKIALDKGVERQLVEKFLP